jgi:hypothetical protein
MKKLDVLAIGYVFKDKKISLGSIPGNVKKYYENNSRGNLTINMKTMSINVPFNKSDMQNAIDYVKTKVPQGLDVYIHFCDPKRSHTGGKNVITFASNTNAIHEFGHAIGFDHSNSKLNGESQGSRDPFDQMTIFAPYPSTNAPHRFQLGWFLPGELLLCSSGTYTIGMLKNFDDKTSVKVLKIGKFFISFGEKDNIKYVTIHTVYGQKSTFIIGMNKTEVGKSYHNNESNIIITIKNVTNSLLTIDVVVGNIITEEDSEECSGMEQCEDIE